MKLFPRRLQDCLSSLLMWGNILLFAVLGDYCMIKIPGISIKMPGLSYSGPLAPLNKDELEIQYRIKKHVEMLAGEIGERNLWQYNALEAAVGHIYKTFRELNYRVATQDFTVEGKIVKNLEV